MLITSLSCLQTAMITNNPQLAPTSSPKGDMTASPQAEPASGAVFEIPTYSRKQTCARVTAIESLTLREQPSEKSQPISWLPANTIIIVLVKGVDWWKVETTVGIGYARARYLQERECR